MTFIPGDTMQSFPIPIVDDVIVENPELFVISLSSTDPSAVFSLDSTVTVYDDGINDGEILWAVYNL